MSVMIETPPALEPLSLADAKAWLRVDQDAEDAVIASLVTVARRRVESASGRVLIQTGFRAAIPNGFATAEIVLPRSPVLAVSEVSYTDTAGAARTTADFVRFDTDDGLTRLQPTSEIGWWPRDWKRGTNVSIAFTAGYGDAPDEVPAELVHAVRLMLAHLYEHRAVAEYGSGGFQVAPAGFDDLVAAHRRVVF
jgi:uncharacterized phiE125 gp8 family phage protein